MPAVEKLANKCPKLIFKRNLRPCPSKCKPSCSSYSGDGIGTSISAFIVSVARDPDVAKMLSLAEFCFLR